MSQIPAVGSLLSVCDTVIFEFTTWHIILRPAVGPRGVISTIPSNTERRHPHPHQFTPMLANITRCYKSVTLCDDSQWPKTAQNGH